MIWVRAAATAAVLPAERDSGAGITVSGRRREPEDIVDQFRTERSEEAMLVPSKLWPRLIPAAGAPHERRMDVPAHLPHEGTQSRRHVRATRTSASCRSCKGTAILRGGLGRTRGRRDAV